MFKIGLGLSSGIVCQNKYQYDILKFKFPNKIIVLIKNPYSFISKENNNFVDRKYVSWIGIYQKQKNMMALLEIVKNNLDTNFKIVGKLGDNDNTSYYEGISNTFLESISVRTPVLSLYSNPNDMITKYKLGEIVAVGQIENRINYYKNKFDYNKSTKHYIDYLKKEHSPDIIANEYIDLINKILYPI